MEDYHDTEPICKDKETFIFGLAFAAVVVCHQHSRKSIKTLAEHKLRNKDFSDYIGQGISICKNSSGELLDTRTKEYKN